MTETSGCCTACKGKGGTMSGPCSDCYGTGCAHPPPLCSDQEDRYERAAEAVLEVMDGSLPRESNHVEDWPEDERDLHRHGDWSSFAERTQAVSRLRARKIVDAVRAAIDPKDPS